MMGFGLLIPIILIAILAYALGWIPSGGASRQGTARDVEDPVEILRKRYARGEIDREEFERMRQDLTG